MIRTQIQLTEAQASALKELAARRGISLAESIRQGVERILAESEQAEKWRWASALVGRYRDAACDVATNHDRYLDVEASQSWFWAPEWQAKEHEVDENYAAGRFTVHNNMEEFFAALKDL